MQENSKEMAALVYKAMEEKQAANIEVINISEVSTIADYFVIGTGNSQPQVDAIVDNIEYAMYTAGYKLKRTEGTKGVSGWILMDFGDVVAHVFSKDDRKFYNLEHTWKDGKSEEFK